MAIDTPQPTPLTQSRDEMRFRVIAPHTSFTGHDTASSGDYPAPAAVSTAIACQSKVTLSDVLIGAPSGPAMYVEIQIG